MNASRLFFSSARAVQRTPMRSFFIMIGAVIGVAALTFVLGVGRGAKRKMTVTIRQIFGDSSLIITAGGHQIMGGPRPDAARLTLDDIQAVVSQIPEIETWDPEQVLSSSVRNGHASTTARVLGASERFERVWSRRVVSGEAFSVSAVNQLDRVALIGRTVARELFGDADPLEQEILIDSVPFTVTGVLETFGTDIHGMDRDNEIVVPISTLMRRIRNTDTIFLAKLLVRDGEQLETVSAAARRALREQHGLNAAQPDDFGLITPIEVKKMVGKVTQVLSVYLPLASLVVLAVGGVIAAALMLGSVNARTAEIGLRAAVGAQPRDIAVQFLVETTLTLTSGGILGVLLGALAGHAVHVHLKVDPEISFDVIFLGLSVSVIVGLLAGVLPARRAARLLPAQALR